MPVVARGALQQLGRVDQGIGAGRQDRDAQQRAELLDRDVLQHVGRERGVELAVGLGLTQGHRDVRVGLALGLGDAALGLELGLLHLRLGLERGLRRLLLGLDGLLELPRERDVVDVQVVDADRVRREPLAQRLEHGGADGLAVGRDLDGRELDGLVLERLVEVVRNEPVEPVGAHARDQAAGILGRDRVVDRRRDQDVLRLRRRTP